MPLIEVLPNSTSISTPGWAYVPDTGYDPSKAPIQPSGARKRARIAGLSGGDTTARQNNALVKRLADLDKDNLKDVQIAVPSKQKDGAGKASKGKTPVTRKILLAQKTFANYIADEEALTALAAQEPQSATVPKPRAGLQHRASTQPGEQSSSTATQSASQRSLDGVSGNNSQAIPAFPGQDPLDLRLLQSFVPLAPSAALLEALVNAPPLSYNAARAAPESSEKPQRVFCELCGYWGLVKCIKCGARVCGLNCMKAHEEERCQKYFG